MGEFFGVRRRLIAGGNGRRSLGEEWLVVAEGAFSAARQIMAEEKNRAVFLSYASQDADVATRICEALRAAGIVVWFDQRELRGGDVWDGKIKGQIGDCALFVAVISANTQTRREGYFRLEWKLAEDRSHVMAKGTPFIVPVSVDATSERGALVPEAFLAVQWMRLRSDAVMGELVARVGQLLGMGADVGPVVDRAPDHRPGLQRQVGRRVPAAAWAGVIAVIAIGVGATFLATRKAEPAPATVPNAGAGTRPPTSEKGTEPRRGAKSIAVLPFDNLSEDKEASLFFSDGMHQDVITNLLLIRELACVPHTTVMSYRGTKKSHREIAEELGVAYVLTGSVRRAQNEVRITAALINPRTDEAMWTKVYDKGLTKIFAVQAELAQAIAGEMKAVLSPQEKQRVEVVPTTNAEAYDLFLKARGISRVRGDSTQSLRQQESLLERAVVLDPRFGLAWARLATVDGGLYAGNWSMTQVRLERTREALAMAERLIPDSPDYFMSRGWVRYMVERDLERAADDYRKVVELAPSYPEPRYALIWLQIDKGLWVQAMQGLNEVERLDPANPQYAYDLFSTALAGRRYAEAEIALRRAETLGREGVEFDRMLLAFMARGEIPRTALPRETDAARQREFELMCGESLHITRQGNNSVTYTSVQALALSGKGEIAAARALLDSPQIQDYLRKNDSEPKNAAAWANTAVIEALRGNRDEALRRINLALEIQPESKDSWGGPLMRCNYAMVLTWIGEREKAVDECALRLRTPMPRTINYPWMRFNVYAMRQHPAFAPLCGDPRFEALLNDPKNNAPLF